MTGFYIAIQEGFTVDEGLDAEMVLMNGTLGAQGMVARQVDFGMSAGASLAAALRGAPLRLVFVQIDKPLYFLFTQPGPDGCRSGGQERRHRRGGRQHPARNQGDPERSGGRPGCDLLRREHLRSSSPWPLFSRPW